MKKLTEWYGSDQKPERAGLYEIREKCNCCVSFAFWKEKRWWRANSEGDILWLLAYSPRWRGLAAKPSSR